MARAVLSKEEVIRAAMELEAQPSGVANSSTVFEALGRKGSYGTILKILREWRASRPANQVLATAVIPPKAEEAMTGAMREIWTLARSFAQEEVEQVKSACDQKVQEADLQRLDAEGALAKVEKENESLEEAKVGLEKRVSQLEQELAAKEALRSSNELRLHAAEQKIAGLETQLTEVSSLHSAVTAQLAAEQASGKQALDKADAQIRSLTQKSEEAQRATADAERQVQTLTAELKRQQEETAIAATAAREAAAAAVAAAKEEAQKVGRLEVELGKAQAATHELRERMKADQDRLDSFLAKANPK